MSRMMRIVSDKIVPQIPAKAVKVVLDVSGDGTRQLQQQEPIEAVRDELVKYGVTVNGLPILKATRGGGGPGGCPVAVLSAGRAEGGDPLEDWFTRARQGRAGLVRAARRTATPTSAARSGRSSCSRSAACSG